MNTFFTSLASKCDAAIGSCSNSPKDRSIYKNNGGIALGRPYNPGPRMRFLGLKFRQNIRFLTYKVVSNQKVS